MKVVLTPAAERDLEEIGDYIAADNPAAAVAFIRDIRVRCGQIADSPRAAPERQELGPGIRFALLRRYRIFYRLDSDVVRVIRILHGARNISALFR